MQVTNRTYDRCVFSTRERDDLRDRLIAAARDDERVIAAAIVGSCARDAEDAWSDIDLALRLSDGPEPEDVVGDWTTRMYESADAVDHLDVWSGTTLFRVFLLESSLQVDLSFWSAETFAASGSSFRIVFGEANDPQPPRVSAPGALVGMGWLYALHARSSIARGRALQALYMINGIRDQVVALACLRYDLPAHEGRGVDDLPADLRLRIAETLVRELDAGELRRAFAAAVSALLEQVQEIDPDRERRLREVVQALTRLNLTDACSLRPGRRSLWHIGGGGPSPPLSFDRRSTTTRVRQWRRPARRRAAGAPVYQDGQADR